MRGTLEVMTWMPCIRIPIIIYIYTYCVCVYIYIYGIFPVADFGSGSEYTEYALLKLILKRWLCGDPDKFGIKYSTIYG